MKAYIFPLFITSLGLFAAYVFYALWHTEEVNPPKVVEKSQKKVMVEDLSNKKIIPKKNLNENRPVVPEASPETHSQLSDEKEMSSMMEKQETIPNLTPEQMETKTQAVYDALTPEDYEETMSEASEAFEALDAHVEEVDAKLAEQREGIEEMNTDTQIDESIEEQNDETMEIPENEEEVDMEQEDVNNL